MNCGMGRRCAKAGSEKTAASYLTTYWRRKVHARRCGRETSRWQRHAHAPSCGRASMSPAASASWVTTRSAATSSAVARAREGAELLEEVVRQPLLAALEGVVEPRPDPRRR